MQQRGARARSNPAPSRPSSRPIKKSATKKSAAKRAGGANPLLARWSGPFRLAPFDKIETKHFAPALVTALKEHKAEVAKLAAQKSRPTFANTIAAIEKSGQMLGRVCSTFFNLAGTDATEELQAIEREFAPKLAAHQTAIMLNAKLFERVEYLYERRDKLGLNDEQMRVLELHRTWLVRSGAKLGRKAKARVAEINERAAMLGTKFAQNVLKDEQSWHLVLEGESDLAGLPDSVRAAAARAANDLGHKGKHAITLGRSSVEAFLQFSERRDLREQAFAAWVRRGEVDETRDNRAVMAEIVRLRGEVAALLGYATFADYSLEETMAKTPAKVRELLGAVWPAAVKRAGLERDALQERARAEGGNFAIAAWDWRYYAEKERKARYEVDESATRPYFTLQNVIAAAFDTASRLFKLRFEERPDLPRYHPQVRTWEVKTDRGEHIGVFLGDYFARTTKRSGAWMSNFRSQSNVAGRERPIVVNVMNFAQGEEGQPTLLSLDDARTLFHEFGHALHGLLSDVTYSSISGTSVARDFVELPSQLFEHWLTTPEVLQRFALHHETGKPMPQKLTERLKKARNFNQGFSTVEYVASALVDMELHALTDAETLDVSAFERTTLDKLGMPSEIVMRHRLPAFPAHHRRLCGGLLQLHVVGGNGRGRFRRVRGSRRSVRRRDGKAAQEVHLFGGQHARPARGVSRVPWQAA